MDKKLEDVFMRLQLSTEDIVLETWRMLKDKYDKMLRKVLDAIALWYIHNDIKGLTDAQENMDALMKELDGILDPAYDEQIEDMTKLFAEVFAFNADYARKTFEIEDDDEDYLLLFSLLGLAFIPWTDDGVVFSDRMITRKAQLKDAIKSIILRASVMGSRGPNPRPISTRKLLEAIRKEATKAKYRGTNVVVDESNHFANEAVKKVTQNRFSGYEISGVLDFRQCATCRSFHGKQFTWDEYSPGLTAPQWHSHCRCRIIPIKYINSKNS